MASSGARAPVPLPAQPQQQPAPAPAQPQPAPPAANCNGTAVALLRYVDLTPEEHEVAVTRLGTAKDEDTRVPVDVLGAARSLWEQHVSAIRPSPPATWADAGFNGCCEVQWDPDLGVHGCDHGGGDDLGRQSVKAIGQAIASLADRSDHLDGSALLDALRNHTAQHDDLPLPPTVATWHMAARGGQEAASLSPLGALFWVAHLVAEAGGEALRHVVAQARVIVRERWDARWIRNALLVGVDGLDARWLAVLVVAASGDSTNPAVTAAQNVVVREARRALSGSAVHGGVAQWRHGLEDALRTAPVLPSHLPGIPALRWSATVMAPLLASVPVPAPSAAANGWVDVVRVCAWPPAGADWVGAVLGALREHAAADWRFYDQGTPGLVFAVWCWTVEANRPLLGGWDHPDQDLARAVCDTLGPGFAALRRASHCAAAVLVGGDVTEQEQVRLVFCDARDEPAGLRHAAPGVYIAGL